MNPDRPTACVLVDAFRHDYLQPAAMAPRLTGLAKRFAARLRPILGYSDAIRATVFTGVYPDEHGYWMEYCYRPRDAPMRRLAALRDVDSMPVDIVRRENQMGPLADPGPANRCPRRICASLDPPSPISLPDRVRLDAAEVDVRARRPRHADTVRPADRRRSRLALPGRGTRRHRGVLGAIDGLGEPDRLRLRLPAPDRHGVTSARRRGQAVPPRRAPHRRVDGQGRRPSAGPSRRRRTSSSSPITVCPRSGKPSPIPTSGRTRRFPSTSALRSTRRWCGSGSTMATRRCVRRYEPAFERARQGAGSAARSSRDFTSGSTIASTGTRSSCSSPGWRSSRTSTRC